LRAAAFVAALACAAGAHADFQDEYALGLRAVDEGRFEDARKYLERALALQSEPVDKVMLNGNVEQPYLPYHFLGIVAWKLGECDTAKAQWGNPTNRRMIGRINQIRQQEQRLAETCKPKATIAAAPPEPPPPAAPAEAPPAAAPAEPENTAPAKPPAARTQAPRPATEPPPASPASERAPPARLLRAVEEYLSGRYADAERIDPESLPAGRARFHAYLVRAAARYTLAQVDGDKALLGRARADAASAYRLDPQASPDEIAFSPAFRAFYAQSH
jgi:hypothetical protein